MTTIHLVPKIVPPHKRRDTEMPVAPKIVSTTDKPRHYKNLFYDWQNFRVDDLLMFFHLTRPAVTPPPHHYLVLLGMTPRTTMQLLSHLREGIKYRHFLEFTWTVDEWERTMAELLYMPQSRLARRKKQGRFSPAESELLVRYARLYGMAIGLLEIDEKLAWQWMKEQQPAFDYKTPLEMARTEVGGREVERLIECLEEGVAC